MVRRSLFEGTPAPVRPAAPSATEPQIETLAAARPGSSESPYSIVELSRRIEEVIGDGFPRTFWLEGELSSVSRGGNRGHLYLSFREARVVLQAVAWETDVRRFDFAPRQGDRVRALGRLTAYAGRSQYQFQIQRLERAGIGALLQELLEREARLEREGLFDPERKRLPPYLPLRIGLLTAIPSDAWADFTRTARTRFPGVLIRERNTLVQGPGAPKALIAGIRDLGRQPLDVIVVARGGGSVEDLLPFSDEAVVRAAAACPVPLVSAIGHEQDRPLLDRVADLRAGTPSLAAQKILPERSELLREIEARRGTVQGAARRVLGGAQDRLAAFRTHRATTALPEWLERERQSRRQDRTAVREAVRRAIQVRDDRQAAFRVRLEQNHPAQRLAAQFTQLSRTRERLARLVLLRAWEERLESARRKISPDPLQRRLDAERAALAVRRTRRAASVARFLEQRRFTAETIAHRVEALDPKVVLQRGYSLALDSRGRAVLSSADVQIGDPLRLLLGEGELDVAVEEVRPPEDATGRRRRDNRPRGITIMTESDTSAPRSEPTFESLERELKTVTGRLEDPAVPLEERLRLHAQAVSLHGKLEAILERAREATGGTEEEAGPAGGPAAEDPGEPYEAVRDRLAEVVNALEQDDLPLARMVELHREAEVLAARCEAILDSAQERIVRTAEKSGEESGGESAGESGTAPPPAGSSLPASDEDQEHDVPF